MQREIPGEQVRMRIEQIKESQRKKGRLLVRLEDGNVLRVTEEELLRFGLRAGMELDGAIESLPIRSSMSAWPRALLAAFCPGWRMA